MAEVAPIAVFLSGGGTNLQAILDAPAHGDAYRVALVVSDRADALGLTRARQAGIATRVVARRDHANAAAFDQALLAAVSSCAPSLVVLAGFMRILGPAFVREFRGRLVNIHPSLLPKYKGLDTYARALEAGDHVHGTSVHFVTEELDGGPVIAQAVVPIARDETIASLREKAQQCEYEIYPRVIRLLCRGHVCLQDDQVLYFDQPLQAPLAAASLTGFEQHDAL